ncbi:MAG: glycosyltransferase, partial [Pseudonocardiaceae bacterium]
MLSQTRRWFSEATVQSVPWTVAQLVAAKRGRTVSVVLPALNEQATVGAVVSELRPLVGGLVDELVVMDSGCTDRTAEVAREA